MAKGLGLAALTTGRVKTMRHAGWLLATAFALAAAGCGNSSVASNPSAAPAASPSAPAAPTSSQDHNVDILSVLTVEHQVDVVTQRDGAVIQIAKDEGSRVKAGETLAKLDDRTIVAQLDKVRADLQVMENNVKYQEAELKAKKAAYRRQQQLRESGLSSDADLEQAEFLAKGAEYDLASVKSNVEHVRAEIRELQLQLDQTVIRAPFSGVVARRYLREGQNVTKDEKCFRVSQLAPLQVQFQVPETSGRKPRQGDTIQVALADDAKQVYAARIVKLSPTVDAASDSYDVTAQLLNPDLFTLRPGMAVRLSWPRAASATKP
jgi:RND family efflux transporter MFP subunit